MSKRSGKKSPGNASGDYEVGYGKPPKSGQFQSGQSGNPNGRPRNARVKAPAPPDLRPTARAIREEGLRMIAVRNGEQRENVSTTTAVMRALAVAAVRQGPMAMREFVKIQLDEEERYLREKQSVFESWKSYKDENSAAIERARRAGRELPQLLPHPEDIELDFHSLSVRLLGPVDEESAKACERLQRLSELLFQLMIYHGEDHEFSSEEPLKGRLGIFGLMYWQAILSLPPRLRTHSDEFHREIDRRLCFRTRHWEALLTKECELLGVPFFRRRGDSPTFALEELAMKVGPKKWQAIAEVPNG